MSALFPQKKLVPTILAFTATQATMPATPRTFGFGIPYTEEFNSTAVNEDLLEDLASTTKGRVLSIDNIPSDLFKDKSDSKQSETPIWSYLIMIFLLLLIADVAARKLLNLSSA